SGWRGALPHGKASDKIVAAGEWITLDFGALYQGYCSDMTRTFLVPGAGAPQEHPLFPVYHIVLEAQLAAIAAIRPGARCLTVDAAARDRRLATLSTGRDSRARRYRPGGIWRVFRS
ncbi:Aminopeptidase YpdF, partial [Salmonella enterica subsp. enterica serovar Rubislaw str. A4-653]